MAGGDSGAEASPELTAFQLEVARLFFGLPESKGFLLAGGAALLAQHLTTRPTEDLDFFTALERGHVPAARDALESAARQRGWGTERILASYERPSVSEVVGLASCRAADKWHRGVTRRATQPRRGWRSWYR